MTQPPPSLAYHWGEDALLIERAARAFAQSVSPPGETMATFRASLDDVDEGEGGASAVAKRRSRTLDAIEQHLASMPLFGAGTIVIIRQPAGLLAENSSRERLLRLVASVPPGNALCVTDLVASGATSPAAAGIMRDAIAAAGGLVEEHRVPAGRSLETWLEGRARELGIDLEPGAARLLAERVGGHVREGDVDRRRRTELADAELEKLALYRPGGRIGRADVEALVSESIPGSTWAFLDAVAGRSGAEAARLAERLLTEGSPLPVLVAQLHRRSRELVQVREHIEAGSTPSRIVREMRLQPFRAQKLSEGARRWTLPELEDALADLLALDLRSKGISLDGSTPQMSERIDALLLQAWLARHVAPRQPVGAG